MEDKDYIEIYDEKNGIKKMEIVLMFQTMSNPNYKYIIYKEFSNNELFAGKIKNEENAVLETDLSQEEKEMVEKNLEQALKQE